jgi:hypothetical protein
MYTEFHHKVSALFRNSNANVDDYISMVREAERLGCEKTRATILLAIQDRYPRSLDLAAPKRAVPAFKAIGAIILSLQRRHDLTGNTLPNQALAGIGMTNPVPRGPHGGMYLPMFVEVAFAYRNREGYRATVALRQENPHFNIEYAVSYNYPDKRRQPLVEFESVGQPDGTDLPVPKVVTRLFEYLLNRVIAGQDLDGREKPGAFYR